MAFTSVFWNPSLNRASQVILVLMGIAAFAIALHPPKLLGIFGQLGVYGIVAASTVPILYGILFPNMRAGAATAAAVTGIGTHFGLSWLGRWAMSSGVDLEAMAVQWPSALRILADTSAVQLGLLNPAVTATYGLLASALIGAVVYALGVARHAR